MHVEYAQLPPPEDSADRIFITDNAVIVLDGATAFVPVPVSAQTYADHLGRLLAGQLTADPLIDLQDALATAIRQTTTDLDLTPGESPSATVSILRERADSYDLFVLGDSPILWGNSTGGWSLSDDRIDQLDLSEREHYRARLRAGHGYDAEHHESLRALQGGQAKRRNTTNGYWIAEADPEAARHALVTTIPRHDLGWAVIATDGAFDPLDHERRKDWPVIAGYTSAHLAQLLDRLHAWERDCDPDGQQLPRAKRHDDKTVAAIQPCPAPTHA